MCSSFVFFFSFDPKRKRKSVFLCDTFVETIDWMQISQETYRNKSGQNETSFSSLGIVPFEEIFPLKKFNRADKMQMAKKQSQDKKKSKLSTETKEWYGAATQNE